MPAQPALPDEYTQRYHALSLAASLQLPYKTTADVLKAAKEFHAYLTGEKK